MRVWLRVAVIWLLLSASGCSLISDADETSLRAEYASTGAGETPESFYNSVALYGAGVGAASQAIPGLHIPGLIVDVGYLLHLLNELIYGTGAIIGRSTACPALLETRDYWNVVGAWFSGIKDTAEFEAAFGLATTLTPFISSAKATQIFAAAIQTHGAKLVGIKLAGILSAKVAAKGVAGFIPVLGPIVAGGINWYILHGIKQAAQSYYEVKAKAVCGGH